MEQRIYHGNIEPERIAQSLMAYFNRGNYRVQLIGSGDNLAVQVASSNFSSSGGKTALSVTIQKVADGVLIQLSQQAWMGVAASLGISALQALQNPLSLINRLDDIAQDIESIQLTDEVWKVVDGISKSIGSGHDLSERLKRVACSYCGTANPVGEPSCLGCGAPLGYDQPDTCKNCGYVVSKSEAYCPNCKKLL
ncbi:MAG: zinc ribbon domain-containing protein [Anaerolineaceae bacterium]|nr:zinc ribbon domain-containing protein [Anaerolineaceae bacterium]NTV35348.1 zinc ribbon domain-containing protein [Anaerolineaceae bacterium]